MSEKKQLNEEQLEKINGGQSLSLSELDKLIKQVQDSTELDIDFLLEVLVIASSSTLYAGLYTAVTVRLKVLGYEIRVDGVYLGEVLIKKLN